MHCHSIIFFLFSLGIFPLAQSVVEQHDDPFIERDEVIFPKQYQQHREHRHHRLRRAPAVWGEPTPDYSAVSRETSSSTALFLYALLFVDLKTSDHYRREHAMVKREVMRLANEANTYFFQIGIRLIIVDILETFRDDLSSSLYSFEQYRNLRLAQLPFHNIAVLISHRYAGGLAFIGGMCTSRNVMMSGFYPHNPEAMASIFFHEVAHLIGVPHRPVNETFAIPNCACARGAHKASTATDDIAKRGTNLTTITTGCLKIPGFDHDCSLQWMVNLVHEHNRCLSHQLQPNLTTLALCGNGVPEGTEQCDCGLGQMCTEWNCEALNCTLKWPIWTMHLAFSFGVLLVLFIPALGWRLYLQRINHGITSKMNCLAMMDKNRQKHLMWRGHFMLEMPKRHKDFTFGTRKGQFWHKFKWPKWKKRKKDSASFSASTIHCTNEQNRHLLKGKKPIGTIWRRMKAILSKEHNNEMMVKQLQTETIAAGVGVVVRRPIRPPPPPPLFGHNLPNTFNSYGRLCSSPNRPKMAPPLAPQAKIALKTLRPTAPPPKPPKQQQKWNDDEKEKQRESSADEDDEWDSE